MTYQDKIHKTEEGMMELIDMMSIPTPDRFIASLKLRNYNELDVDRPPSRLGFGQRRVYALGKIGVDL